MNCPRCKSLYWRERKEEPAVVTDDTLRCAVSMYSEGKGCMEIAMALDIPLEAVVLEIRSVHEGFVRIS
jgi:transposase-like protein